jgi:N-acetylmuramoyl-L-alanine amidase
VLVSALAVLASWVAATAAHAQSEERLAQVQRIMIDPGHGGTDAGCIGIAGIAEKELTLKVSRRLRSALAERFPALETELTREDDSYPTLEGRTHQANLMEADVLLSLHFNCAENHLANGIETFFLHPEGTAPGEQVPGLEHLGETLHHVEYGVSGEAVALIEDDLRRVGAMLDSARLAEEVQGALIDGTAMTNRGVRYARFRVLRGAHMPAIVAELGFLTNSEESEALFTSETLDRIVSGLVEGLVSYDLWLAERAAE